MPAAPKEKSAKREGPNPAHILIRALRRAVDSGVDKDKILMMLDMADEATGTEQAPMWKNVTRTLDRWSAEKDGQPANGQSEGPAGA